MNPASNFQKRFN